VAADEGHGFAKKANSDYAFLAQLAFWEKHLLGRCGRAPSSELDEGNPTEYTC
jgi:hypothetical protein